MITNPSYEESLILSGDINHATAGLVMDTLINKAAEHSKSKEYLKICMNTHGGMVTDGMAIIGAMNTYQRMKNNNIVMVGYGAIFSMGLPIFVTAKERAAEKNTMFMYHCVQNEYGGGIDLIEEELKHDRRSQATIDKIIVQNTDITLKQLDKARRRGEWFFSAEEALGLGVIHHIL